MQVNYANSFPFRPGVADVHLAQSLTLHEAVRLWWLPKSFTASISVDCPHVPSPGTPVVFDFSGASALVRVPPPGVPADEEGLAHPGLDLGAASYGTGATFTGSKALYSGMYGTLTLRLFLPYSAPVSAGVWTDGTSWQVRAAITGTFTIGGQAVVIYKDDDAPPGVLGSDYETIHPDVRYLPESGVEAPYTRETGETFLWVGSADALAWEFIAHLYEATWFEHGGLWLPTAGTARQRDP